MGVMGKVFELHSVRDQAVTFGPAGEHEKELQPCLSVESGSALNGIDSLFVPARHKAVPHLVDPRLEKSSVPPPPTW